MRKDIRRTLITYDIPQDRRRTKVAQILESFGDRVQYSVFVIDTHPAALLRLKEKLRGVINNEEDSILFCDLGLVSRLESTQYSYLGREREVTNQGPLVI